MMFVRLIGFVITFLAGLFLPLPVFTICVLAYALRYGGYELLVVSVLIDAWFGDAATGMWYLYTLLVSATLLVTTFGRPYLRFYH